MSFFIKKPMTHHLFPIIIFLVLSCTGYAQKIQYLDPNFEPVKKKEYAMYYRTVENREGKFLVKDFFLSNNQLQSEAFCRVVSPKLVLDGKLTCYREDGTMSQEGSYRDGKAEGIFKHFYEDGRVRTAVMEKGDKSKYIQHWSIKGEPALTNGSGNVDTFDSKDNETNHVEYRDSIMVTSYMIRHEHNDTVFVFSAVKPDFPGGAQRFSQGLLGNLNYPVLARRRGVEGRVFVRIIIDKEGAITEAKTIKGIGSGCDEAAEMAALANKTKWSPGKENGRPVKTFYILPVNFKLK
jgi:TonB family protein